jgi:Ca2+-binding EF-hand superfamily protein
MSYSHNLLEKKMKKSLTSLAVLSCFVLGTTVAHADADSQGKMQEKLFKSMDTNSDGNVTREEYDSFADKQFKKLDANGNNQITLKEMKDGARKMMSGGRTMEEDDYKRMGDTKDQMGGRSQMGGSRSQMGEDKEQMGDTGDSK